MLKYLKWDSVNYRSHLVTENKARVAKICRKQLKIAAMIEFSDFFVVVLFLLIQRSALRK